MDPQENNQSAKPFFLAGVPLGVKILAAFNFFVTGILGLFAFLQLFGDNAKLVEVIKAMGGEKMLGSNFTPAQLRMMLLPQAGIALFFIVTALGVLYRKEWARKALVYFSFFLAVFMVLGVVARPAAIAQIMVQAVHPGVMIYYFTGKKIVEWFTIRPTQE